MSFFKQIGKDLMGEAGNLLGGGLKKVGEVTGSKFVSEVGDGVHQSMEYTGSLIGGLADGAVSVGSGIINQDGQKIDKGLGVIGENAGDFGKKALKSAQVVVEQSVTTAGALMDGDFQTAKQSGAVLAKVAAISVVSIGVVDGLDGIGSTPSLVGNADVVDENGYIQVENHNTHEVSPHFRTLPSGEVIWVDGDGDTSVDRMTGWEQTNPNYRIKV